MLEKEKIVKVYVACDGKEFDTEYKCKRYEDVLKAKEIEKYVEDKAIALWYDAWNETAGFVGAGGEITFLIEVTDEFIEKAQGYCPYDRLEDIKGERWFFRTGSSDYFDGEWFAIMSLDQSIEQMAYALEELKRMKTQEGETK